MDWLIDQAELKPTTGVKLDESRNGTPIAQTLVNIVT
jgi:hypothetical protein